MLPWRAAALTELGRMEEALEAYGKALKAAPEDVELLLGAATYMVLQTSWVQARHHA